jgi:hypothetical protein
VGEEGDVEFEGCGDGAMALLLVPVVGDAGFLPVDLCGSYR